MCLLLSRSDPGGRADCAHLLCERLRICVSGSWETHGSIEHFLCDGACCRVAVTLGGSRTVLTYLVSASASVSRGPGKLTEVLSVFCVTVLAVESQWGA